MGDPRPVQGSQSVHQRIGSEIQSVVVGQRHDVHAHFIQNGYLFRRQTEGVLFVRRRSPPAAEGEFLVDHKQVAARNNLPQPVVQHAGDIPSLAVSVEHMVREQHVSAEHQAHGIILGFSRFGFRRLCRIPVPKGTAVSGFIPLDAAPVNRAIPSSAKTGIPKRLVLTAGRSVCSFQMCIRDSQ